MLSRLTAKNFRLLRSVELDFEPGRPLVLIGPYGEEPLGGELSNLPERNLGRSLGQLLENRTERQSDQDARKIAESAGGLQLLGKQRDDPEE